MKIIGATVGTSLPKPNFDQTDPKKGDYIKGDRSFLRVDDSLTEHGISADAKAVGDAINEVQSNIDAMGESKADKQHTHTSIIETNKNSEQKFWRGTKSEYDAIDTKDPATMYIVTDSDVPDEAPIIGLPNVGSYDDGRVLQVVNGAWVASDVIADIESEMSGKADVVHTHAISDVSGLNDILDTMATEAYVDEQIAAIPTPDVSGQIGTHNVSADAHIDIRDSISDINTSLSTKSDVGHGHSYNDLSDKPSIPSIDGLATETYVDNKIATIPTPDVSGQIDEHNTSLEAHVDIRESIDEINSILTDGGVGYVADGKEIIFEHEFDYITNACVEVAMETFAYLVSDTIFTEEELMGITLEVKYPAGFGTITFKPSSFDKPAGASDWYGVRFESQYHSPYASAIVCKTTGNVGTYVCFDILRELPGMDPPVNGGRIYIPETIHIIDQKFISDEIARKSDIPSIDGLASENYVGEQISVHNTSIESHADIRDAISDINSTLTGFMDAAEIGDAAIDTLKEIQDYITTDGEAAALMTSKIQANADAIVGIKDGEVFDSFKDVEDAFCVFEDEMEAELNTKLEIVERDAYLDITLLSSKNWQSVKYCNGKFIALAYNSNIAVCSEDGITWTEIALPRTAGWTSVTYGNGKFVAVATSSDVAAYSEDGITWHKTNKLPNKQWWSVTYGNGKFVAVAQSSDVAIYSEDGITWAETTMPQGIRWQSVTYGNGKFVAVAYDSDIAAYSEDGINWTETTMPQSGYWFSVTYGNGKFVTLSHGQNVAAYSENGETWIAVPAAGQKKYWQSVTHGNGKFVAVAYNSNIAVCSEDGITWTEIALPRTAGWTSVTYGNGKFVAVATSSDVAAYSEDGITWVDKYVFETYQTIIQNDVEVVEDIKNIINIDSKASLEYVDTQIEAHNTSVEAHADIRDAILEIDSELGTKADSRHTHSYNDLVDKPTIPANLADLTEDETHRTVTDAEKELWNISPIQIITWGADD